jgi:hypothetical protein
MKIRTKIRGGGMPENHSGVKVKTKVRSGGTGGMPDNHNGVKVKTKVRAGDLPRNHSAVRAR